MKISLLFCLYFSSVYGREEPSRAMESNEILLFDINTQVRKECKLSPAKYYVKKQYQRNDENEDEFVFYAARYNPSLVIDPKPYFPTSTRDEDNIARLECTRGYLDYLRVKLEARKCGLAKVLTILCMIEPHFHLVRKYIYSFLHKNVIAQKNKVIELLKRRKDNDEVDFLRKCRKLIGLENIAKPTAGAFAYLSAAHLTGYQNLVVDRYDSKKDKCVGEFLNFNVNDILTKKTKFDAKTGLIGDIDGTGHSSWWYFCTR